MRGEPRVSLAACSRRTRWSGRGVGGGPEIGERHRHGPARHPPVGCHLVVHLERGHAERPVRIHAAHGRLGRDPGQVGQVGSDDDRRPVAVRRRFQQHRGSPDDVAVDGGERLADGADPVALGEGGQGVRQRLAEVAEADGPGDAHHHVPAHRLLRVALDRRPGAGGVLPVDVHRAVRTDGDLRRSALDPGRVDPGTGQIGLHPGHPHRHRAVGRVGAACGHLQDARLLLRFDGPRHQLPPVAELHLVAVAPLAGPADVDREVRQHDRGEDQGSDHGEGERGERSSPPTPGPVNGPGGLHESAGHRLDRRSQAPQLGDLGVVVPGRHGGQVLRDPLGGPIHDRGDLAGVELLQVAQDDRGAGRTGESVETDGPGGRS